MQLRSAADIAKLVEQDPWMMDVLYAAEKLQLPDWWIGAGFLRNKVWDALSGNQSQPSKDVDLVYFNDQDTTPETDWAYDEAMKRDFPFAEWEIRNQARMHYVNGFEPYISTADGIRHWVETATCVAVKLEDDELRFLFCHGVGDLLGMVARPTSFFTSPELIDTFRDRVAKKQWRTKWPQLRVTEAQPGTGMSARSLHDRLR